MISKQVGNYRILSKISSGSFGSVYEGRHVIFEDDPIVAIKLLHSPLHSQQERTEFIKEAQLLKKLQHPHILHIIDAGFQDGIPYLITEYAEGGSLRNLLLENEGEPLLMERAIDILLQIGQALHYANERHIVHRDLKPENILFNEAGNVLLADFGIAVLLASAQTKLVGLGGSPPYMAPEQFEGLASAKSDQYALGCIAYELVTGRRLFTIPNPSLEAYWYHHAKVEPTPPRRYQPQIPKNIEQAILTALAKDRTQRHTDISAFSQALHISNKTKEEWLNEGNALYTLKRYEEALGAFDHAIRLDPNHALAHGDRAIILIGLKRYEEALTASNRAILLDPNNAIAYQTKGIVLTELGRNKEALAAYEQTIRLDPNNAIASYNKGTILTELRRIKEALAAYEQAIRLDPNYAVAYNNKGNALQELGRYREALTAYEQVIHLDPNFTIAYNNKGNVLQDLEEYEKALAAYEQVIHLDPNFALAYYNKGNALNNLEGYEEALTAFDQAIYLDPNNALAYYNKGIAFHKLGETIKAQQAFEKARQLGYAG